VQAELRTSWPSAFLLFSHKSVPEAYSRRKNFIKRNYCS
jgi:hypothetical protein